MERTIGHDYLTEGGFYNLQVYPTEEVLVTELLHFRDGKYIFRDEARTRVFFVDQDRVVLSGDGVVTYNSTSSAPIGVLTEEDLDEIPDRSERKLLLNILLND